MRSAYRVLAWIIAAEVAIQAMVMVFAVAGLVKWVDEGGVFDRSVLESDELAFPEITGIIIHGLNGMFVIPALALILLIFSFFTKAPGAVKWAALVLLLVVLQVVLGFLGFGAPIFGALHGFNALLLFSAAVYAGLRVKRPAQVETTRVTASV
jgi:heme A synthase